MESLILSFLLLSPHTRWFYTPVIKHRAVWAGGWCCSSESGHSLLSFPLVEELLYLHSQLLKAMLVVWRAHRALDRSRLFMNDTDFPQLWAK